MYNKIIYKNMFNNITREWRSILENLHERAPEQLVFRT